MTLRRNLVASQERTFTGAVRLARKHGMTRTACRISPVSAGEAGFRRLPGCPLFRRRMTGLPLVRGVHSCRADCVSAIPYSAPGALSDF